MLRLIQIVPGDEHIPIDHTAAQQTGVQKPGIDHPQVIQRPPLLDHCKQGVQPEHHQNQKPQNPQALVRQTVFSDVMVIPPGNREREDDILHNPGISQQFELLVVLQKMQVTTKEISSYGHRQTQCIDQQVGSLVYIIA